LSSGQVSTRSIRSRLRATPELVRWIAIAEATSFLLLFGCMGFKYAGPHNGVPVLVMGWIHGVLFLAYLAVVFSAYTALNWSKRRTVLSLIASVVPFAPYFVAHHERESSH
jgi:integral membrane protein